MIASLDIIRYLRDNSAYTTETLLEPDWATLELRLGNMHRFDQPILWLCLNEGIGDTNAMAVTGGESVYHIQIADEDGYWIQAVNPNGSSEMLDLWISDQGFSTEQRFTWNLEQTLQIVKHYFLQGEPDSGVLWEET